jgi:peptidoglycan/xylan/chitin deacetylase (PgdA/CDA1 family)
LTYHRIVKREHDPESTPGMISATQERFDAQVRFLARHYEPVALEQVLRGVRQRTNLPRRAVLITFDDGYRDFATAAWPILKRYQVPATLFVPTAYPDRPGPVFWWDRLYRSLIETSKESLHAPIVGALTLRNEEERRASFLTIRARLKGLLHDDAMQLVDRLCADLGGSREHENSTILSWQALRALASEGVSLASHTHTHPLLNRISRQQVRTEVATSIRTLEREIGPAFPVVSYPNGAHDDAVLDVLRQCGVELGFTQLPGHNDLSACDPLRICRINVTRRTTVALLRLRLQSWFAPIERWRKRKRIRAYQSPVATPSALCEESKRGATPA